MPKVLIVEGPNQGRTFDLIVGPNVMGRGDDAQIKLPSGQISRKHAVLTFAEGRIFVEDLGSSNGTYVNGTRIQKVELRQGNKIRIGEYTLEVVPDGGGASRAPLQETGPAAAGPGDGSARGRRGRGKAPAPAAAKPPAPAPASSKGRPASRRGPAAFTGGAASAPDSKFWKIYAPLRVVPWTLQVAVVMFVVSILTVAGVLAPSLSQAERDVSAEALKRAETLVNALAMKNGEFIKTRNDINYDTQSFLQNEGVSEAYLLSREMVILSPPTRRNQVMRNALTNQVQNSRTVVTLEEPEVDADGREGTYHLATPIRVWNSDAGRYDIYGFSYLVFRADQVGKAATGRTSRLTIYSLVVAVITLVGLVLIVMLTIKPISALRDDAELALRGDIATVQSRARFTALENLAHTLNRALEKSVSGPASGELNMMTMPDVMPMAAPAMMGMPAAAAGGDDLGDAKVQAIASAVTQGVLILDDMQRVVYLNRQMEQFIGRSASGLEGRHVMEVVSDPQVLGTVLDLFKQIITSPGSMASQPVQVRGQSVKVVVSGVISASQELKYAAVVVG